MAQTIKLKRSASQGAAPSTSQLELGEVAINTYDGRFFLKKEVTGTPTIMEFRAISDIDDLSISGTLSLTGTGEELRFYEGSNYVGFSAPALSADQIWVLPDADGAAGEALKTDGSGNLIWGTAGDNAFQTISVSGQSDVVADSTTDTLTLVAGTGIQITTDAGTDTVTFTNTGLGDNAFGNFAVSGQDTVEADNTNDTLTLVAGTGISITTDAVNDSITITNSQTGANAFGNIAVSGQDTVEADGTNDTVTFVGSGITITTDSTTDTITFAGGGTVSPLNTDLFTAGASQTDYSLSVTPNNEDELLVFVEGVYQNKNSYTLSGSTLILDSAPSTGDEVVVHSIGKGVSGSGHNLNSFTGDDVTTDFTLSVDPDIENNVFVFFDGVYQHKSEFSVSGTTLSFTTAPPLDTDIEVIVPTITEINTLADGAISSESLFDTTAIIPQTLTSTTLETTSQSTIATHDASTYRTVKYLVQCTQGTDYHATEINLIHDGTTVYITEYGTIFDNAVLGTFDATLSGGNILLQMTPGSATSMTVKVVATAVPV